jgi:hypothetical protein
VWDLNLGVTFRYGRAAARRRRSLDRAARRGGVCFVAATLALLLPIFPRGAEVRAQTGPSVEYQVKAAFLLNFARFVVWPADAFASDQTPITFCVFRQNPFGAALDEITQGKTIANRGLAVRRVEELPDLKTCQLVFISAAADRDLPAVLDALKASSALVVGESEGFAGRGGGIQFYLDADKVRFTVNVDATKRARLSVSSKLLSLAKIVHDDNPPKAD